MDAQGWADVTELLTKSAAAGVMLTLDELKLIVAENEEKRFVLNDEATRIRAAQGDSVEVELRLPVKGSRPVLFTARSAVLWQTFASKV